MARRAIFSEGCGLRVRKCGPDASRGITYSWGANDGPVAQRGRPPGEGIASRAGVRSRPSEGWASQGRMASRGKPGDNAKGDFLGGTSSARPEIRAGRRPRHVVSMGELATGEWPNKGDVSVGVMPTLRACGARPSEGVSPARMALRRKARDVARGGFLGGARSPRPQGTAGRRPRHNMIIVGK
jgi:hypothetical protein